jgi:archaellum component FlaG (FlaF/FlaG flagellin family)
MSNAIVTLFVVALMLVAVTSWSQASFSSLDSGAQAWKQMVETATEVARTDIEVIDAQWANPFAEVLVRNCGEIRLALFSKWDVLVNHYDGDGGYYISWLSYTEDSDPGNDQWTVAAIYTDATLGQEEVFEPGILNPGEVVLMKLKLTTGPGGNTTNRITVSTPSGVIASAQFEG